jgi:hypothetical protein
MRKIISVFAFILIILVVVSVFATAEIVSDSSQLKEQLSSLGGEQISDATEKYVENFAEKKGVNAEDITGIKQVDFNSLPKEVNIENINDNNLAIYQVDYQENSQDKKLFVVTYSTEKLKSQGDLIVAQDKREFLSFGFSGKSSGSTFLKSDTDVETSFEKGYVMMRGGSITGISTNLEILKAETTADIEIVIYKNGEPAGLSNLITASQESLGVKTDYDIQSKGIVTFEPGDVISVYLKNGGNLIWKDDMTLVEITTSD